ncbi:Patatin-Like Phospholipase Domain-Containing Protein 7 [Manis pentadactyla]|nr:Patatin-Like Phospholipase Domain-Containing Protein 7 [Manis pentadactyla]
MVQKTTITTEKLARITKDIIFSCVPIITYVKIPGLWNCVLYDGDPLELWPMLWQQRNEICTKIEAFICCRGFHCCFSLFICLMVNQTIPVPGNCIGQLRVKEEFFICRISLESYHSG